LTSNISLFQSFLQFFLSLFLSTFKHLHNIQCTVTASMPDTKMQHCGKYRWEVSKFGVS
jgi:hypothetical protein